MTIIKTWDVRKGRDVYDREIAEITRGRADVKIVCKRPGTISVIEWTPPAPKVDEIEAGATDE